MREASDIDRLMDRAASGDRGAFGDLSTASQDGLYRFTLAQGLRTADAAEAVQETLLRAYRARGSWRRGGRVRAWLRGIAMNVVRETRRGRRREKVGLDLDALAVAAGDAPGDADQDAADRLGPLAAAIEALPPRQREVVACRFILHMSVRQTAQAMGCAEGTVKATVSAALAAMRERLRPRGEPDK